MKTGNIRWNAFIFPAYLLESIRLQVERIMMGNASTEEHKHNRPGPCSSLSCARSLLLKGQKASERQAEGC